MDLRQLPSRSIVLTPLSSGDVSSPSDMEVGVSWATAATVVAILVAATITLHLLGALLPVFMILLEALLLTCALIPPVNWLIRRGIRRSLAVTITMGGIGLVAVGVFAFVGPAVVHEAKVTAATLPSYVSQSQLFLRRFPSLNASLKRGAAAGSADPSTILPYVLSSGGSVVNGITDATAAVAITAYLLAGGERSIVYLEHYVPLGVRVRARRAGPDIVKVVSGYVFGQVVTSLLFGIFTVITLTAFGVPQPILLGILAAICDAIPLIGTLIATLFAVLMALTVSPATAVIVLALFLIYNVIESNLLIPKIYGRAMGISSLAVLIAVLIGYRLFGLIGVFTALPLAAAIPQAESAWRRQDFLEEIAEPDPV